MHRRPGRSCGGKFHFSPPLLSIALKVCRGTLKYRDIGSGLDHREYIYMENPRVVRHHDSIQ